MHGVRGLDIVRRRGQPSGISGPLLLVLLAVAPARGHAKPGPESPPGSSARRGDAGTPAPAGGAPSKVAVLPPDISPPLVPAVVARFRKAAGDGLTLASLVSLPPGAVDRERQVDPCVTSRCLARLGSRLGVRFLAGLRVRRTGKNYRLTLWIRQVPGGISVEQEARCDICTLAEAVKRTRGLAMTAGGQMRRRLEALRPRPRPPRRKARLAPRPRPRRVRPRPRVTPRPRPRRRKVRLAPRPKPWYRPSRTQRLRQAAWMSAVGGALSLAAGVALLVVDDDYGCDQEPRRYKCPYRYDTGAAGAAFSALGAASLAASGVLFYLGYFRHPSGHRPRVTVTPTRGGIWAHATFRY